MAVDLSEFEQYARRKGPSCSVALAREGLGPDDQAKLDAALCSHYQSTAITNWLRGKGGSVGVSAVARHRRGDCACDPA